MSDDAESSLILFWAPLTTPDVTANWLSARWMHMELIQCRHWRCGGLSPICGRPSRGLSRRCTIVVDVSDSSLTVGSSLFCGSSVGLTDQRRPTCSSDKWPTDRLTLWSVVVSQWSFDRNNSTLQLGVAGHWSAMSQSHLSPSELLGRPVVLTAGGPVRYSAHHVFVATAWWIYYEIACQLDTLFFLAPLSHTVTRRNK